MDTSYTYLIDNYLFDLKLLIANKTGTVLEWGRNGPAKDASTLLKLMTTTLLYKIEYLRVILYDRGIRIGRWQVTEITLVN